MKDKKLEKYSTVLKIEVLKLLPMNVNSTFLSMQKEKEDKRNKISNGIKNKKQE